MCKQNSKNSKEKSKLVDVYQKIYRIDHYIEKYIELPKNI